MLSDDDLERYARQAIMPAIGEEGQEQLLAARVLVVGAGGLGAPGDHVSCRCRYWHDYHY
jgi:molybdopterin/thiamine biosynthesis adenylyltransferase